MLTIKLIAAGLPAGVVRQITGEVAPTLTGAGSNQATALQLGTQDIHVFTTVGASTGGIFQPGTGTGPDPYTIGDEVMVVNHGANTLSLYPATGGKIANGSANAAFSVAATKTAFLVYLGSLNWAASVSA